CPPSPPPHRASLPTPCRRHRKPFPLRRSARRTSAALRRLLPLRPPDSPGSSVPLPTGPGAKEEPMGKGARRAGTIIALLALGVATLPRGVRAQSEDLRQELEAMRKQLRQMQEQLKKQQELIDKLTAEKQAPAAAAKAEAPPAKTAQEKAADEERLRKEITASIMKRVQPQLAAANK